MHKIISFNIIFFKKKKSGKIKVQIGPKHVLAIKNSWTTLKLKTIHQKAIKRGKNM